MLLVEPLEDINKYLLREYGTWSDSRPRFRVVWSDDQFEKRFCYHTKGGFELVQPIVLEMPKYRPQVEARYVLEQLSIVPSTDRELTENLSYEPVWVFQDRHGNYLPPRFDASKIIIDEMYTTMENAKKGIKKYSAEELQTEDQRVKDMGMKLFGEETPVGDALRHGYGVTVPENKLLKANEADSNNTVH